MNRHVPQTALPIGNYRSTSGQKRAVLFMTPAGILPAVAEPCTASDRDGIGSAPTRFTVARTTTIATYPQRPRSPVLRIAVPKTNK